MDDGWRIDEREASKEVTKFENRNIMEWVDERGQWLTSVDFAKLVREVAIALMGGHYVSIPCAGGGSVSSETGWDGRKKDEEDENFRLRCWLHAAKTVKVSRNVKSKRKGFGR